MASTASKPASRPHRLSPLEFAVLVTVLYGDLFDHPLTPEELHRFLTVPCPDRAELETALAALDGRYLSRTRGFVCWRGREATIEVRRRRRELAAGRWRAARRFARWLAWVPFLRAVAVCGSQAVDNGDEDGDVDLFLITAPGRLWLVQSAAMALRRAGRLLGVDFCPNYLLSEPDLAVANRSLYSAREAAQAVPLWGGEAYGRFLQANGWIGGFLPQLDLDERRRLAAPRPRHRLTRALERALGGRLGDLLDRAVYRALLRYYALRLAKHGWSRREIERAYRRDRQEVITGGYAAAVAERFVERGLAGLGGAVSADELRRWFLGADGRALEAEDRREDPDPLYAGLMAARYGGGG